jgi:hypothetical protein
MRKQNSAKHAHGYWTSAMRTSENPLGAKFVELPFHALG